MSETAFPAAFVERTASLLGASETERLLDALNGESPVSIRFNPYKIAEKPEGEQVPWCRYGYYLDRRPSFTLDPAFHAGAYYVQEAGSMFLETIFRQVFPDDGPLRVLDLCAAPGGKTTLLSTIAGAEGLVVANEPIRNRASVLAENVRKWGIGNVAVTCDDPSHFAAFGHGFDLIVVDAPCSGEGMFRKDRAARDQWSLRNTELCAARQRRILGDVWPALHVQYGRERGQRAVARRGVRLRGRRCRGRSGVGHRAGRGGRHRDVPVLSPPDPVGGIFRRGGAQGRRPPENECSEAEKNGFLGPVEKRRHSPNTCVSPP